jgi:glutathione synthase/RimK-type ligase-like ATP-grasp enzyme
MKTILMLNDCNGRDDLSGKLKKGYEDVYSYFFDRGIVLCRSPIIFYDKDKKKFKMAQFFDGQKWRWKENIVPDLIYDKSRFFIEKNKMELRQRIERDFPFLNPLKLSEMLSDKWQTYLNFKKYSPGTILIKTKKDLQALSKIRSSKVVLKPLTGSGGEGVEIADKIKISRTGFPFLIQEFIKTEGVPGIVKGPHDIRVIMRNEEPFYSFVRIPPRGKFIANLAEGGRIRVLDIKELPKSVNEVINFVSNKLKKFKKKLYAVDFIFDNEGGAWILEMNSRPGITLEKEEQRYKDIFYGNLMKFLTEKK